MPFPCGFRGLKDAARNCGGTAAASGRLGWIRPAGPDPCRTDPFLGQLGPDPLGGDFTPAALQQALARHPRAPVKAVLLDQTDLAGIGNIYADEVLHRARIDPSRPAGGLGQAEAHRLHAAIQVILRAAVDSGGTSFADYVNQARGRPGYLGQAHVFRRQACPATCAVRRSSAPRSLAARRTSAPAASNAEANMRPGGGREAASPPRYRGRAAGTTAEGDAVYSKIKIAGHPVRPMLVAFPVASYTRILLRQAGYATESAV